MNVRAILRVYSTATSKQYEYTATFGDVDQMHRWVESQRGHPTLSLSLVRFEEL